MIIEGQYLFNFSPEKVFDALNDPTVLLDTIPGATSMSEDSPSNYSMTITAGVAVRIFFIFPPAQHGLDRPMRSVRD